ncbi:hypothetical protein C882_3327 [Caenispirillum salinarum AK4]|uniref:WbqC-like protein n=1 Tax=Caenispirillum salinarum AK4 TaxID=1238182 RepID=K9GJ88_9PROT|nr:WbqC family protein [Caenispirillum salinarum]EKV26040.1 hypothetical protein C882_3327 [Caenispirillum salinarum AK4]
MILSTIQPSFLPWLGYLEQAARADLFVYLDDVQYTKQDWRNRNRFKTPEGRVEFLTVPVTFSDRDRTLIRDVPIARQPGWQRKLLNRLESWYRKAPAFDAVFPAVRDILSADHARLIDLDVALTTYLFDAMGIDTPTAFASEVPDKSPDKNRKLIDICHHFGADVLYDGAAAAAFIDTELFRSEGITVIFQDYRPAPYPQVGGGDFVSHLSALDALFNCGDGSRDVLLASLAPPGLPARCEVSR